MVEKGYPLIAEDIFSIKRWYKIAFPKDAKPFMVDTTVQEPDWENVKQQENGIHVRWCSSPYLVYLPLSQANQNSSASLTSIKYVARKNVELRLKSKLPCNIPMDVEKLHSQFLSKLYTVIGQAYGSPVLSRYLNTKGDSYSRNGYTINTGVSSFVYWVPRPEDIYFDEVILPPPGDPVLVVKWLDQHFFISAWDTNNDDDNLKTILEEFVI
jgi:hypothetical protein